MSGQRITSSPQVALAALVTKREKLQEELRLVEKQVYDLETSYLHDSSQCGNVLRGFEGFLSSTRNTANLRRSRKFQPEDRLFSLSSVTSPAVDEHVAGRDDGRTDPGRSKATGMPANGQGKQKKGRATPREGKRIKQANDQELEDDDDPDLCLR